MARRRGRGPGPRGPYKADTIQRDVEDPDQLGTGGIRVRQHRLAKGWTMEVLAAESGLSVGTISGIEGGKQGYSPDTLQKLAKGLRTSVGALFDVDPRPGRGNDFWRLWNRASDTERQRIFDYSQGVVGGKK